MSFSKAIIFICFAVLIGVPLVFRPASVERTSDAPQLIIVTPHNEQIRYEFKRAFEDWHRRVHGSAVNVVYNVPGGTSEIRKLLESQYKAALESGIEPGGQADLVFGGGSYEHGEFKKPLVVDIDGEWKRQTTIAQPVEFDQAWLDKTYGPNEIGGRAGALYDPDRHWFGVALSGFGIVFNRDALKELGVDEPTVWSDLTDPKLEGWVALVNPSQSGSVKTTFEAILHREGWAQGWQILRRASGNARYFSASSLKPPIDVSQGNAAMGVAIDFYGRFQSQAMKEAGDPDRIGYVDPIGGSTIDADPITVLRGARQPELAKRFIEFALSDEGQALWQFRTKVKKSSEELGPERFELRRMIITRSMYERQFPEFIDQVNPYEIATPPKFPDGNVRDFISPLFAAMAMDTHHELREAWKAIVSHPGYPAAGEIVTAAQVSDPTLREMLTLFDAMPSLPGPDGELSLTEPTNLSALRSGWVKGGWKEHGFWSAEETAADAMRRRFGSFFRTNYRRIIEMAATSSVAS